MSSIPKSRTGLVQSLLSLHTHSSPAHPRRSQGALTGRPTSPGRPGSPDSSGSPCTGKKRMEIFTFLQGDEFSAGTAKPLHECCSKLLLQACEGALPSLLLHQDFLFPQEDPVDRLLLVAQMDLWVLVGLVDPERKGGQISDGFLRAMSVREKRNTEAPHHLPNVSCFSLLPRRSRQALWRWRGGVLAVNISGEPQLSPRWMLQITCKPTGPGGPGKPRGPSSPF